MLICLLFNLKKWYRFEKKIKMVCVFYNSEQNLKKILEIGSAVPSGQIIN